MYYVLYNLDDIIQCFVYFFLKAVIRSVDVMTTHKPSYTITNITPTMDQHHGNKPEATNIGKSTLNVLCR